MPPKFDPNDPAVVELVNLFKQIGLSESKATDAARAPKNAAALKDLINTNDLTSKGVDEKRATLLVSLSVSGSKLGPEERAYAVNAILDNKLKSTDQLNAAVKYLESHRASINDLEFDKECGVGFTITPEEILTAVRNYVSSASVAGWNNITAVLGTLKGTAELRWAPTLEVKTAVETVFLEKFGPKEAARAKAKEPKEAKPAKPEAEPVAETTTIKTVFEEGFLGKLHKPGGNPQIHPRLREGHMAATGGQVYTRFPPEPNGFLHIGHCKAIFVNFGYAAHHNGKCYLRYDDTNPEAEEGIYFESILESVRWLGFEPYRITYSSDYFQELYDLAVDLIRRDKAYICHCTPDEMVRGRGGPDHGARLECIHRNRPIEESIAEFQDMKDGKYRPGTATLRMKQDILGNGNPHMWDMVAYRTLDAPHHRTGTKWKIYPTYDYTHCLVDSFENISHSLCTTEFILARESYEWLCDALEVYKPRQSEYGRLNLQGTIMSKRKIIKLVKEGHVKGWDDPRLYTIVALRRRGVPPGAILSFVGSLGVSTALTNIQTTRFEQAVRQYLENTAPRLLMVLHPLKVTIENIPEGTVKMLEKPLHPKIPALGTSSVPLTRTIYIEEEDFRVEDQKDYFRLAPGKTVGLFGAGPPIVGITCTSFKTDPATGKVTELICYLEDGSDTTRVAKKPKTFIQWVAEHAPLGSPVRVHEARIFHQLFKSDNPAAAPNFLDDISPNTLEVVKGAMVEVGFWSLGKRLYVEALAEAKQRTEKALKDEEGGAAPKSAASMAPGDGHDDTPKATTEQLVGNECVRFQGLRVAYFALDKDAKLGCLSEAADVEPGLREGDLLILNRIVSLKEDSGKAAT